MADISDVVSKTADAAKKTADAEKARKAAEVAGNNIKSSSEKVVNGKAEVNTSNQKGSQDTKKTGNEQKTDNKSQTKEENKQDNKQDQKKNQEQNTADNTSSQTEEVTNNSDQEDEYYHAEKSDEIDEKYAKKAQEEAELEQAEKDANKQRKQEEKEAYADAADLAAGILSKIPYTAAVGQAYQRANDASGGMLSKGVGATLRTVDKVTEGLDSLSPMGSMGTVSLSGLQVGAFKRTQKNLMVEASKSGAMKTASAALGSSNSGKQIAVKAGTQAANSMAEAASNKDKDDKVKTIRKQMVFKDFLKDLWDLLPIFGKIFVILLTVLIFFALMGSAAILAISTNEMDYTEVKDYNSFVINVGNNEYKIEDYVLGSLYLDFFVKNDISESTLTDSQLVNATKAYFIIMKTMLLKIGNYDSDTEHYSATRPIIIYPYPQLCNINTGCYKNLLVYEQYDQEDETPYEERMYKPIDYYEEGSVEYDKLNIVMDSIGDNDSISEYIIVPEDITEEIHNFNTSNFYFLNITNPDYQDTIYNSCINGAADGYDYFTIIKKYINRGGKDYKIKLYKYGDYVS